MNKHSQITKSRKRYREPIATKLIRYLTNHPTGVSAQQLYAWINACTIGGGYDIKEFDSELVILLNSGRVSCVNKIFHLRNDNQQIQRK